MPLLKGLFWTLPSFTHVFICSLFFFKAIFSNWRKSAFQYCVGFSYSTMQVSHNYTYITSLPLTPPPGRRGAPGWAPCAPQQLLPSCLFYAWQCTYVCATFSICPTLSPPHCVYEFILYICVSVPSLQIGSSIPSF